MRRSKSIKRLPSPQKCLDTIWFPSLAGPFRVDWSTHCDQFGLANPRHQSVLLPSPITSATLKNVVYHSLCDLADLEPWPGIPGHNSVPRVPTTSQPEAVGIRLQPIPWGHSFSLWAQPWVSVNWRCSESVPRVSPLFISRFLIHEPTLFIHLQHSPSVQGALGCTWEE